MSLQHKIISLSIGLALASGLAQAQIPKIDKIHPEEIVSSSFIDRPSIATDSKAQPHIVCDPGGTVNFMKFHKINNKWQGGVFATGSRGGPYSASRLYVGQIEVDGKDRAWISCKFGCKEFGSMLGQGVWLYENITNRPSMKFFRHINVHKGMGVVTTDAKYPDRGVVIGTFGNWYQMNQFGQGIGKGSLNAGHGGEKVRARIASYAPRFRAKSDTKAYKDGIWHTAMNGFRAIGGGFYQNSVRRQAGLGPVMWDAYSVYPSMGDDFHHPGVGIDLTDPRYAYISTVFGGNLCINIWDGSKMLFNPARLRVVAPAAFEIRHAPACTPAPGPQGGVFYFWSGGGRIKGAYVSKKGVVGPVKEIGNGRTVAAATDRDGNIHLAYNNNGLRYRKLTVSSLQPLAPKGGARVTATRSPTFRWTDTKAAAYTVELTRDGVKLEPRGVSATTWTPSDELGVGSYSWRVKEGWPAGSGTWSPSATFVIPPALPEPVAPNGHFATAVTPTFEWTNEDPEATRYTIELFKDANSLGAIAVTGDIKNLVANWTSELGAGLYYWRIRATRYLSGYTVVSDWSAEEIKDMMTFQVLVPGPVEIVAPGNKDTVKPGNGTVACNWTEPEGNATAYTLKLLYNGKVRAQYPAPNPNSNIVDTNYSITQPFQPGYHTLFVQPRNAQHGNGPWSQPVTFLVSRDMIPKNGSVRRWPPSEFEWTRSEQATKYLVHLSKYNWASRKYVVQKTAWIDQPKWKPKWSPAYNFKNGKYRWSVTDYAGNEKGYTSRSVFWIKRP